MKKLSLFVSAFALCASASYAAIDCGTLPDCGSLGYTDTVSQCPNSGKVLKCPFDTTKGKCIYDAAVGSVQYFPFTNPGGGWLKCDGSTFTQAQYPDLYAKLGQTFCTSDHGGTCGSGVGRVPKYDGYFLRVYGAPAQGLTGNTNLKAPQQEGLPNIIGNLGPFDDTLIYSTPVATGPFSVTKGYDLDLKSSGGGAYCSGCHGTQVSFKASDSNTIYGRTTGVTPPNYAVYAYIYAGKKAQ